MNLYQFLDESGPLADLTDTEKCLVARSLLRDVREGLPFDEMTQCRSGLKVAITGTEIALNELERVPSR